MANEQYNLPDISQVPDEQGYDILAKYSKMIAPQFGQPQPNASVLPPAPTAASQLSDALAQSQTDKLIAARNQMKAAGINPNKLDVKDQNTSKNTTTVNTPLNQDYIDQVGGAIRSTPEWQQQASGLNDLDHLIAMDAQRKASKTNIDLSPLGAYLDYQNGVAGQKSNFAQALKGEAPEETNIKDMGEIQRRRADMAKELINTIKASKVGSVVDQNGNLVAWNGGVQPIRPFNQVGKENHDLQKNMDLYKITNDGFKETDAQLNTLNTISQRLANYQAGNRSEGASMPILLQGLDTPSKRILSGILGLEETDPTLMGKIDKEVLTKVTGKMPEEQAAFLQGRVNAAANRAMVARKGMHDNLSNLFDAYGATPEQKEKILESRYGLVKTAYPSSAAAAGVGANNVVPNVPVKGQTIPVNTPQSNPTSAQQPITDDHIAAAIAAARGSK